MVCCHDPEILNNFEQGTELTFSFSTRPQKIMWPILSLLKWHHHYPCHWNHPPGQSHPGFSLPSFPHLIMLFHAKQGITFPPFQRVDFHLSINYYSRFIYSSDTDCCPVWYRHLRVIIFIFILRPASVTLSLHAILSLSPKWLWASWRLILFSFYLLFPGLHLAYRKYFLMFIK